MAKAGRFFYFESSVAAKRVQLALAFKRANVEVHALDYFDDQTFFDLGVQRKVPLLQLADGRLLQDSEQILWQIDELFPQSPALVNDCIDADAWQALLNWRSQADRYFQRLYAPLMLAYVDVGGNERSARDYTQRVQRQLGVSVEALASDRYALYAQLEALSSLKALARLLGQQKYYMPSLSIADCLLAADFFPLQLMDGINLPIDLLYYLQRIEQESGVNMQQALLRPL